MMAVSRVMTSRPNRARPRDQAIERVAREAQIVGGKHLCWRQIERLEGGVADRSSKNARTERRTLMRTIRAKMETSQITAIGTWTMTLPSSARERTVFAWRPHEKGPSMVARPASFCSPK